MTTNNSSNNRSRNILRGQMSSLTQETPQAQGRERTTLLPSLLRILSIFKD